MEYLLDIYEFTQFAVNRYPKFVLSVDCAKVVRGRGCPGLSGSKNERTNFA